MTAVRRFVRIAATAFTIAICGGTSRGAPTLDPAFTPAERALIARALGGEAAPDDFALRASLLRRATAELGLRLQPSQTDGRWAIAPPARNVEADLEAARAAGQLEAWLTSLSPVSSDYRALAAARDRYKRLVEAGGWTSLPAGQPLREGASGPVVPVLRTRLAIEGYLAPSQRTEVFDAGLSRALVRFQQSHGLPPDGVLGPQTAVELNVPAELRLMQLEANLERRRWLRSTPEDRMEVDIAAAEATLYGQGTPRLVMRVVVGDLNHKTPMFASRMESVVINPPWNVPASIASAELLPKEAANPGYLARNHFTSVAGALQQRPGPWNALGRLKFDFPSPFGVYLHDTPGRAAFSRPDRRLSHGCIRLEKPRELASALLADEGWTPARVDAAIDAGATLRIPLKKPLPLYVVYWTARVEADGGLHFRPDSYGWDAKLMRALSSARTASLPKTSVDSECAAANSPQPML